MSTAALERSHVVQAYQVAIRLHQIADDRLSLLLVSRYGKRAGDMRYRPAETPAIADAMRAKVQAAEIQYAAWSAYQHYRGE